MSEKLSLQRLSTSGTPPTPRIEYSYVVYKDSLYLFGGKKRQSDNFQPYTLTDYYRQLYEFNFKLSRWNLIQPKSFAPASLCSHSAVTFKDQMIVFGGICHETYYTNDVLVFDFGKQEWSKLETKCNRIRRRLQMLPPMCDHIVGMSGDDMIVHGGIEGSKFYDDFYSLHIPSKKWKKTQLKRRDASEVFGNLNQIYYLNTGKCRGFVMDQNLFLYGGMNTTVQLDLRSKQIVKIRKNSKIFPDRSCPAGILWRRKYYVLDMSCSDKPSMKILDLNSLEWEEKKLSIYTPRIRYTNDV